MAGCLLKAGYQLAVYDSNPDRTAAFAKEHGIEPAATLADLGKESDVVITILPNSAIVDEVLFGPQGLASSLRAGAVVIEMTSGIPSQTVAFSERLARQGVVLASTLALPTGLRGSLPPRSTLPRRSHSTVCRLPQTWLEPRPPSALSPGTSTVWPSLRRPATTSGVNAPLSASITSGSHWWW